MPIHAHSALRRPMSCGKSHMNMHISITQNTCLFSARKKMDVEKLIEAVRKREILYVTTSKSNKNSGKKKPAGSWPMSAKAWHVISDACRPMLKLAHCRCLQYRKFREKYRRRQNNVCHIICRHFCHRICISFAYGWLHAVVRHRKTSWCVLCMAWSYIVSASDAAGVFV